MIKINWISDEVVEISLDDKEIIIINHDDHGWEGMRATLAAVKAVGAYYGATIVEEGTPNL